MGFFPNDEGMATIEPLSNENAPQAVMAGVISRSAYVEAHAPLDREKGWRFIASSLKPATEDAGTFFELITLVGFKESKNEFLLSGLVFPVCEVPRVELKTKVVIRIPTDERELPCNVQILTRGNIIVNNICIWRVS